MEKIFLSSGQAAKKLGVSQDTLARLEKNKKLIPHHKSDSGYRYYTENQIYEFLEGYYGEYEKAHSVDGLAIIPARLDVTDENSDTVDMTIFSDKLDFLEGENRQGKGIVAQYHYFSTSKLVRELKGIYLNEMVTIPLGKAGYVDVMMWLDKNMQMKLMPTAFNTPEDELHPSEFDLFIIESVKSLKNAGNKEFTAAQLVKHMHGNSSGGISDEEIQYVEDRIKTMMTWFIRIEVSEEFSHYPNLPEEVKNLKAIQGHLLDTVILERKDKDGKTRISFGFPINGCFGIPDDKDVSIILETYSESTKQLTCFPTALLNIPKMRSSRAIRILTNYLVKKIQGLKGNRKGIHNILFSTIEEDLYMTNFPAKRRTLMRKCMITIVQSCKERGQIKDYEVIMEGTKYKGIKIEWETEVKKKNARNGTGRSNKVRSRKSASVPDSNG